MLREHRVGDSMRVRACSESIGSETACSESMLKEHTAYALGAYESIVKSIFTCFRYAPGAYPYAPRAYGGMLREHRVGDPMRVISCSESIGSKTT